MHSELQRALRANPLRPVASSDIVFLDGKPHKNLQYCHELVRDTAKALAGAIYESAMVHNENYEIWQRMCVDLPKAKHQDEWIRLMWPRMLDDARATLAQMLAGPISEDLKSRIHNALILDSELRRKGHGPKPLFRK